MEFETESGSVYRILPAEVDGYPPVYQFEKTDKDGNISDFRAEILTRVPIEMGTRVMLMVAGDKEPILTTKVVRKDDRASHGRVAS